MSTPPKLSHAEFPWTIVKDLLHYYLVLRIGANLFNNQLFIKIGLFYQQSFDKYNYSYIFFSRVMICKFLCFAQTNNYLKNLKYFREKCDDYLDSRV